MIKIKQTGSFKSTESFLENASKLNIMRVLNRYGQDGVDALASATPVSTGLTSNSWSYKVRREKGSYYLEWSNSNRPNGVLVAVLLQYGHGTRNGGYVEGVDYINPSMKHIFETIANEAWKEVTNI